MAKEKAIDIQLLEFPECIRTRTGMYVGSTDNPDVILREIIDNSIDELMGSKKCNTINIQIKDGQKGGWYVVADNGRGIPIIMDEDKGITKTELAIGSLHAGSKFTKDSDDISVGLNGVGSSCTNALSSHFIIMSRVTGDNFNKSIPEVKTAWETKDASELFYYLHFEKGYKTEEGCLTKSELEEKFGFQFQDGMSTIVAFKPDTTIWKSIVANYNKKSLSYVGVILDKFYNKSCKIYIDNDLINEAFIPYKFEFVKEVRVYDNNLQRDKVAKFYVNFEMDTNMSTLELSGSVNSLIVNRGLHIEWLRRTFQDSLKYYYNIQHDYTQCGLKLNVVCLTANMDFSSQTKERVVKIDGLLQSDVEPKLATEFRQVFEANKDYFEDHVTRLNEFASTLVKISAINKVKAAIGTVEGGNRVRSKIPSSVRDAASNNRGDCELLIVEGKSASGTMLKARNPEIHAIMELRGVPMNSINLDLDSIMDNPEMCSIVTAIGAGVNEYFRIENCRYGKIILAADSDSDGCFTGDTLVHTLNYGDITFEDLVKYHSEDNFKVWSRDSNGDLVIGNAHHPRVTRKVTKLIKLTLSNNMEVTCTLDHLFLLKSGKYKKAEDLTDTDSLSPFNYTLSNFHSFWDRDEPQIYLDDLDDPVLEYVLSYDISNGTDIAHKGFNGNQIHHIDHDHYNNDPSNLRLMTRGDHCRLHLIEYNKSEKHLVDTRNSQLLRDTASENITRYNQSEDHRNLVSEMNRLDWIKELQHKGRLNLTLSILIHFNLDITIDNFRKYNRPTAQIPESEDQLKQLVSELKSNPELLDNYINRLTEDLEFYRSSTLSPSDYVDVHKVRFINRCYEILSDNLELTEENYKKYKSSSDLKWENGLEKLGVTEDKLKDYITKYNHRVISKEIITYDDPIEVYDLTVDLYHNFALTSGVFVHNCRINSLILGFIAKKMTFLIEAGRVFVALAPLYQQGNTYVYPGEDYTKILDLNKPFNRYKGLGEISVEDAKNFFFNDKRNLLQITPSNLSYTFDILTSSLARKNLMIQKGIIVDKYKTGIL